MQHQELLNTVILGFLEGASSRLNAQEAADKADTIIVIG